MFQIGGYRTVELLPTAQQRQTLQKVRISESLVVNSREGAIGSSMSQAKERGEAI